MRRWMSLLVAIAASVLVAAPAWACGGLVAANGAVNLVRTTTLAGYHGGVEHYVTSFEYAGGGGRFGSIVPLPGIPSDVVRGGDWTLQRLVQEVTPPQPVAFRASAAGASADMAEVLLETRIDALDITILKGGADEVGAWALDNGFALPPDAPEVLDFYASRSPIFMAARFDAAAAERLGQGIGDGTPIHLSIPTQSPWVPLRILSLGRAASETVEADVFLLTDREPSLLPRPGGALSLEVSERASDALIDDLRSDKGMEWIPETGMWLSYLKIDTPAGRLDHDLAIEPTGAGTPSPVAAGLVLPPDVAEAAAVLGGLIGFERELSDQPAGFRTHMLVSVGAALFTVAGAFGVEEILEDSRVAVRYDPTRIAAQIVTGIGFLGAGAIIQQGISVRGLTTAASLWVTAAVGLSVGLGYYTGAAVTAVFTVVALYVLKRMRSRLFSRLKRGEARITVRVDPDVRLSQLVDVLELRGSAVESIKFSDDEEDARALVAKVRLAPDVSPGEVALLASDVPGVRGADWYR